MYLKRKFISKLGAGTSLPSVVLSKYCNVNKIIISDDLKDNTKLLNLIKHNLKLNNLIEDDQKIGIKHFAWSIFDQDFLSKLPKINFVVGSDVFFDSKLFEGKFFR